LRPIRINLQTILQSYFARNCMPIPATFPISGKAAIIYGCPTNHGFS
jgi:hypothetical protein